MTASDEAGAYARQRLEAAYFTEMASSTPDDNRARELRDAICILQGWTDLRMALRSEYMGGHDPGDEDVQR